MTRAPRATNAKLVMMALVFFLLLPFSLLIAAGTWAWAMGWLYLLFFLFSTIGSRVIMVFIAPDLLRERAESMSKTDVPAWDKVLMPIVGALAPFAIHITAGLDFQNGWTAPPIAPIVMGIGTGVVLLGLVISTAAFLTNRFFSGTVRIQTERDHQVVSRGIYGIVRHPGYLGGLMWYLAAPVMLGTLWALIPALIAAAAIIVRTALEDRMLQAELPGYAAYADRVRCRLLPGVW